VNIPIVVIGSGPSAFILSLYLQKYKVNHKLVLCRNPSCGKVGESLLPSIQSHFINLNLPSSDFFKRSFIKRGVNFKSESISQCLRFDASGPYFSYNLDRYDLDTYLLEVYRSRGGEVINAKTIKIIDSDNKYLLKVLTTDDIITFNGIIVDATGSPRLSSAHIKNHFSTNLRNKASVFWTLLSRHTSNDFNFVDIFLDKHQSWFWHIPIKSLPDGIVSSIGYVSSASCTLVPDYDKFYSMFDLKPVNSYLNYPSSDAPVHRADFNYIRNSFFDKNLILCGDSAAFVDPMMSSGVHFCAYSAYILSRILSNQYQQDDLVNNLLRYEISCLLEYLKFHQGVSCLYTNEVGEKHISLLRSFLNLSSAIDPSNKDDSLLCFKVNEPNLKVLRDKLFKFSLNILKTPRIELLENISKIPTPQFY